VGGRTTVGMSVESFIVVECSLFYFSQEYRKSHPFSFHGAECLLELVEKGSAVELLVRASVENDRPAAWALLQKMSDFVDEARNASCPGTSLEQVSLSLSCMTFHHFHPNTRVVCPVSPPALQRVLSVRHLEGFIVPRAR
jgi:hypothetical protein